MSQNLIGVLKSYQGKYYVFPETAEATVADTTFIPYDAVGKDGEIDWNQTEELPQSEWIRELEICSDSTLGPYNSKEEAFLKAEEDFDRRYNLNEGFEYGVHEVESIDGVKLVLTFEGEEVDE